ncbi:MAG: hypothetical protein Ct9H90mP14_3310 [Methanobacteriota archaeon]|nr:MAG: hypothetical protein Ct9H90mP14_3310 [Euryarchaeota archaeon]
MADPDWEDVDPDALMRSAKQHDWMTEPRFKRMFEEIEDKLQGVLGSGQYDWVDRRVFDAGLRSFHSDVFAQIDAGR